MTVKRLEAIHKQALNLFVYKSDQAVFNKAEHWATRDEIAHDIIRTGKFTGDCDDFAAYCVAKCRDIDLPARFVFCQTETGEYHLVCECMGYILDNRLDAVLPFSQVKYVWISISGSKPGAPWTSILGAT